MKKFVKFAFVAAFAAIAGYGVYSSGNVNVVSSLTLANLEALASDESDAQNGYISYSYNQTISETEGEGYTEIVWEYVVKCLPGGSNDCTERCDRHTTRIYHS